MKQKEARKMECGVKNLQKGEKHKQLKKAMYKEEVSV